MKTGGSISAKCVLVLKLGSVHWSLVLIHLCFISLSSSCNCSWYLNISQVYVFLYRISVDAELLKYVDEHFPGGECAVYCTDGKGVEKAGGEIELTAVISNSSYSPKNFR